MSGPARNRLPRTVDHGLAMAGRLLDLSVDQLHAFGIALALVPDRDLPVSLVAAKARRTAVDEVAAEHFRLTPGDVRPIPEEHR